MSSSTSIEKRAVVIGGSAGMGLATSRRLLGLGYEVWIVGRSQAKLAAAGAELDHPNLKEACVDASDLDALTSFCRGLGQVDHVVLSAGGVSGACMAPFQELQAEELQKGFLDKFWMQFQVAQTLSSIIVPGGSLTFVTAISAQLALPGTSGLAAINGAIESMIRPMAKELAPKVRVNAVSPGVVETDWWSFMPESDRNATFQHIASTLPMQRIGAPGDIARVVEMLVENSFITGIVIPCDGGSHLG